MLDGVAIWFQVLWPPQPMSEKPAPPLRQFSYRSGISPVKPDIGTPRRPQANRKSGAPQPSMPETVPDPISEIAAILAKGFLRYRKSRCFSLPNQPQNDLDSASKPSVHVTVVNAERMDEN